MDLKINVLISIFYINLIQSFDYSSINLPNEHLLSYFNKFSNIRESCIKDSKCKYHKFLKSLNNITKKFNECWGYEENCNLQNKFSKPICHPENNLSFQSNAAQLDTFYNQADFGYVKEQIDEISVFCKPLFPYDSSLECTKNLRFCRGRNIFLNFTNLKNINEPFRYNMNVLQKGEIGGHCTFNKDGLLNEMDHMGALQSWAPELRFFEGLLEPLETNNYEKCDILIEKPTFVMKVDAYTNMYHHFCDFLNLYMSLHVNQSHPSAFSTNVHILVWETFTYNSPFSEAFNAFTDYPVWNLKEFSGKTVCFKNLVFALLPRMIYGLYYNTPLIEGCEKSGLFKAFSEFMLHRLKIPYNMSSISTKNGIPKLRISFLSRRTKYRRVLNEEEILNTIVQNNSYSLNVVSFESNVKLRDQLELIRNTDIFIGMHGAGLTHLLFLPDWATIFELYNCEDSSCYKNLANLRGLNYMTWTNEEKIYSNKKINNTGAEAKFTNYTFDSAEFVRLVNKAAENVFNQKSYQEFIKKFFNFQKNDEL